MTRLLKEDWLHHAKSIPVGRNERFPHKGDRTNRPNLIVYNDADKWSAYCMSCKTGDSELKTHVRINDPAPKESKVPTVPTDMTRVYRLPVYQQQEIGHFLARKGMDFTYFDPGNLYYSESRQRLIVMTPQGCLGRDLTEKSDVKWIVYAPTHFVGYPSRSRINVVTEDTFSMYKVEHALQTFDYTREFTAVCSLGTGFGPGLMKELIMSPGVITFYDGDKAGVDGANSQSKRVRAFGIDAIPAPAPTGFDPKDMQLADIAQHIKEAHGLFNSQRIKQQTAVPVAP